MGSLGEIETQILISQSLDYLGREEASALLAKTAEIGKIIHGLLRSLKN